MEQELDLRPYVTALLRRWRLILGVIAVGAIAAALLTLLQPPMHRARASVLIDPVTSQVVLDPRFTERDAFQVTNGATRRQALIALATSPVLEGRVNTALGEDAVEPGDLLDQISVTADSDLLAITATNSNAEEALRLAELWGQAYADLVAELYGNSQFGFEQVNAELEDAQARYEEAKRAYEAFLAEGEITRAAGEVARLQGLLETSRDAHARLYTEQVSRTQELNLLLNDVQLLQTQIESGNTSSAADGLAALALRLRAADGGRLPLDLSVSPETLQTSNEALASDLERLFATLERERDRLERENAQVAAAIATGDNSAVGVDPQARLQFETSLSTAGATLARLRAEQNVLSQTMALSLNTLAVLQAKSEEEAIGEATTNVNIRYLGAGPVAAPSLLSRMLLNVAIAIVLAGFFAVAFLIVQEIVRQQRRDLAGLAAPPGETAADAAAVPR
jgi:hypothetical protein